MTTKGEPAQRRGRAALCYVYCAAEGPPATLPSTGLPGASPPRVVALDSLALIVSDVASETYAAGVLESRLSDLDWVAAAGAAHHEVIDAVADAGAVVLPFRLFTLFSTAEKAASTLRAKRAAMDRTFDRIRGKQEWVLRIGAPDPARATTTAPAPAGRDSGTSFLQAKSAARREAAARATRVKEDAAAAYEALEHLADEAKRRPIESGGTLMLDAAFLVPPARVEAMHETLSRRAERLLSDGCPVSLTGPWPPYSFASMDATDD